MCPKIEDVVVFPCVPATAKQRVVSVILPKISALFKTVKFLSYK